MSKTVVRVAYETMQFFEVDLPPGVTPEEYNGSDEMRRTCADHVLTGFIDFTVERLFDEDGKETHA